VFRQGPIPAFVHGLAEYAGGALLIAGPFLFGFSDQGAPTAVAILVGVVVLILAASTDMSTGLISSIPVHVHVLLDFLLAAVLIASPFLFGFSGDGSPTGFVIVFGVLYLLLTIATRFIRHQ
jgi:SPW repeat-containing protein